MTALPASQVLFAGLLIAASVLAYAIVLRWLPVIIPAIVLAGFALEPALQLRFTLILLGWLALLYLAPATLLRTMAWFSRRRLSSNPVTGEETALQLAEKIIAEQRRRQANNFENQARTEVLAKAARTRAREERARRAKDLEMQGAFSLWSRRGE